MKSIPTLTLLLVACLWTPISSTAQTLSDEDVEHLLTDSTLFSDTSASQDQALPDAETTTDAESDTAAGVRVPVEPVEGGTRRQYLLQVLLIGERLGGDSAIESRTLPDVGRRIETIRRLLRQRTDGDSPEDRAMQDTTAVSARAPASACPDGALSCPPGQ